MSLCPHCICCGFSLLCLYACQSPFAALMACAWSHLFFSLLWAACINFQCCLCWSWGICPQTSLCLCCLSCLLSWKRSLAYASVTCIASAVRLSHGWAAGGGSGSLAPRTLSFIGWCVSFCCGWLLVALVVSVAVTASWSLLARSLDPGMG